MKRTVIQYRYYDDNNVHNSPTIQKDDSNISLQNICNGTIFLSESVKEKYGNIVQLSIQALPGTTFYVNGGIDPVIIGGTGIFELDVLNYTEIFRLEFNQASLNTIRETENGYLIIDAVYQLEE